VEVNKQANWYIEQFHVAQELSFVDGENFLNGFEFEQEAMLDEHIEAKRFFKDDPFVFDLDFTLVDGPEVLKG